MRGKKREGLIRARLVGASVATAPVLIFLDSHCECTMGGFAFLPAIVILVGRIPVGTAHWLCLFSFLNVAYASLALLEWLALLECYKNLMLAGWLEPLLDRIAENKTNVVAPIIDVLDDKTLRYQWSSAKATSIGGFDWNLQFNWHPIPQRERNRRKSDVEPVQ